MTPPVRVALVQPRSAVLSLAGAWPFAHDEPEEGNLGVAEALAEEASREGADLVVFPEVFPGPSDPRSRLDHRQVMARMCTLAARLGTAIGVGGLHPGDDGVLRNVYALIGPDGRLLGLQEKRVPAVGEASEPGTGRLVVGVGGACVGVAICWEVFFPDLVRAAALDGADLVLCPAGRVVGPLREQWLAVLRARAIENLCVTATTVNLVGDEPGMCAAYHPEGVLGELRGEGCLVVEVDPQRLRLLREADEAIGEDQGFRTIPGLLRAERARCR